MRSKSEIRQLFADRTVWQNTTQEGKWGQRMNARLAVLTRMYRETMFPAQSLGYDLMLIRKGDEQFRKNLFRALGPERLTFTHEAYKFYDELLSLGQMCWNPIANHKGKEILSRIHITSEIARLTDEFDAFTESDTFAHAFTLHLDLKQHRFVIADLHLDRNALKQMWSDGTQIPSFP